jgi:hypothetical protein
MSALGRLVLLCFKHARDPAELVRRLGRFVAPGARGLARPER